MFEILKLYGIPDKIIAAIKVLYTNTVSTDWEKSPFSIEAGILQGDTLAQFLFIIVDYVLRVSIDTISNNGLELSPRRTSRHTAKYLTVLNCHLEEVPDTQQSFLQILAMLMTLR